MTETTTEPEVPRGKRRRDADLREAKKLVYEMETIIDVNGTIRSAYQLSDALWTFKGMRVRIRIEKV